MSEPGIAPIDPSDSGGKEPDANDDPPKETPQIAAVVIQGVCNEKKGEHAKNPSHKKHGSKTRRIFRRCRSCVFRLIGCCKRPFADWKDCIAFFFTAAVAVSAIGQWCVTYYQFKAMRAQNEIADKQWDAMKAQNDIMVEQNCYIASQVELAEKANETAISAIGLMQHEQRPWLSISSIAMGEVTAGKELSCKFVIKNDGHSPGTIKILETKFTTDPAGLNLDKFPGDLVRHDLEGDDEIVIPPNGTIAMPAKDKEAIGEDKIATIDAGTAVLEFSVRITYVDMFGGEHVTRTHFFYNPGTKKLSVHRSSMN